MAGGWRQVLVPGLASPSRLSQAGFPCPVPANSVPFQLEPSPPSVSLSCGQKVGWGLTLRVDVGLLHIHTYGATGTTLQGKADPRPPALPPCTPPCPPVPHHPTSRDLADPVKLRLALHGHPLQGGQVKHCAAPDVIVVMPAPVKIVVRELEKRKGHKRAGLSCEPPTLAERPLSTLLSFLPASSGQRPVSWRTRPHSRLRPPPCPTCSGALTPRPSLQRQL